MLKLTAFSSSSVLVSHSQKAGSIAEGLQPILEGLRDIKCLCKTLNKMGAVGAYIDTLNQQREALKRLLKKSDESLKLVSDIQGPFSKLFEVIALIEKEIGELNLEDKGLKLQLFNKSRDLDDFEFSGLLPNIVKLCFIGDAQREVWQKPIGLVPIKFPLIALGATGVALTDAISTRYSALDKQVEEGSARRAAVVEQLRQETPAQELVRDWINAFRAFLSEDRDISKLFEKKKVTLTVFDDRETPARPAQVDLHPLVIPTERELRFSVQSQILAELLSASMAVKMSPEICAKVCFNITTSLEKTNLNQDMAESATWIGLQFLCAKMGQTARSPKEFIDFFLEIMKLAIDTRLFEAAGIICFALLSTPINKELNASQKKSLDRIMDQYFKRSGTPELLTQQYLPCVPMVAVLFTVTEYTSSVGREKLFLLLAETMRSAKFLEPFPCSLVHPDPQSADMVVQDFMYKGGRAVNSETGPHPTVRIPASETAIDVSSEYTPVLLRELSRNISKSSLLNASVRVTPETFRFSPSSPISGIQDETV